MSILSPHHCYIHDRKQLMIAGSLFAVLHKTIPYNFCPDESVLAVSGVIRCMAQSCHLLVAFTSHLNKWAVCSLTSPA